MAEEKKAKKPNKKWFERKLAVANSKTGGKHERNASRLYANNQ